MKRMRQIEASTCINLLMSERNRATLVTSVSFLYSGSRMSRGPSRKPPAFPSWLKTVLMPVAVVLSFGGNHRDERAGGTEHMTIPATPFRFAPR